MLINVFERLAGSTHSIYTGERRAGESTAVACDLGGDLFYPQSILFQSVNLECAHAVAVRVSEIAQGRNGAGVYVFVLGRASDDTRLNEERAKKKKKKPGKRVRLGGLRLESLRRGNRLLLFYYFFFLFTLKRQYPHAELIKSTLAGQETSNKTQHMETVRLL